MREGGGGGGRREGGWVRPQGLSAKPSAASRVMATAAAAALYGTCVKARRASGEGREKGKRRKR